MHNIQIKFAGLALAAALATSAATLAAFPASAQAAPAVVTAPTQSVTVSHADLNLGSRAGVQRLYARIDRAAEQLCVDKGNRALDAFLRSKDCINETIARAEPQVLRAVELQTAAGVAAASK